MFALIFYQSTKVFLPGTGRKWNESSKLIDYQINQLVSQKAETKWQIVGEF